MDICFEGIGQMVATFATNATKEALTPGMAVTLKESGTVGLGGGNDAVCGVTIGAERGGAVAVQIGGVVKVRYSDSAAPTVGYAALTCDGEGKVTTNGEGGVSYLVLAADEGENEDEKTAVIKL